MIQTLLQKKFDKIKPIDYFFKSRDKDEGHQHADLETCVQGIFQPKAVYRANKDRIGYAFQPNMERPPITAFVLADVSANVVTGEQREIGRLINAYENSKIAIHKMLEHQRQD